MKLQRRQKARLVFAGLFAFGVSLWNDTASAEIVDRASLPMRKLGRGLANLIGGPLELPLTIREVGLEKGPIAGVTLGTLLGVGAAMTRSLVGAVEVVTFLLPLPKCGYEPILQPEFILEPGSYTTSQPTIAPIPPPATTSPKY